MAVHIFGPAQLHTTEADVYLALFSRRKKFIAFHVMAMASVYLTMSKTHWVGYSTYIGGRLRVVRGVIASGQG